MRKIIKRKVRKFFNTLGYEINRIKPVERSGLNLNIGAGNYEINGFKSLDFYSPHYYPVKHKFNSNRINYNIITDAIPFESNTIDSIYVSHVIEHLPDHAVEKLFSESYRVLKPGGVLRISTPDSKFLFNVSTFNNDYWLWRLSNKRNSLLNESSAQLDFLIEELATPKSKHYLNHLSNSVLDSLDLEGLGYIEVLSKLKSNLEFRFEFPGEHINSHDFESIEKLLSSIGFSKTIESKYQGSIHRNLQGTDIDITGPNMSLYVDCMK
jgi:SAM-dependent methyltransferase